MAAELLKEEGNALLKAGDYEGAHSKYTEAIALEPGNHIFYSNRSASSAKLGDWSSALADAHRCIELAPSWAKGYSRQAAAYEGMNDYVKAENAHAQARRLGGGPAARAAGPAPSFPGAAGYSAGQQSTSNRVLVAARGLFVLHVVMFTFPVIISSASAFSRALLLVALCYATELFERYGKPELNPAFAQKLLMDFRSHFALTALLFAFAGSPGFLPLLPHILVELDAIADATFQFLPQVAVMISPAVNSSVMPMFTGVPATEWQRLDFPEKRAKFNRKVVEYVGSLEVGIGISLIFELFTPKANLLVLFAYWHFLRIRYMVSDEVKSTFRVIDTKLVSFAQRWPAVLNAYSRVRTFLASFVAIPTQEELRQRQQAGFLGNLRQNCTIM